MWPSVASLARDINPDPSYSRTTDPDMVLSSIPGQDIITDLGATQATQIGMAPMAAWPLDTTMAPGGGPDYRPHL